MHFCDFYVKCKRREYSKAKLFVGQGALVDFVVYCEHEVNDQDLQLHHPERSARARPRPERKRAERQRVARLAVGRQEVLRTRVEPLGHKPRRLDPLRKVVVRSVHVERHDLVLGHQDVAELEGLFGLIAERPDCGRTVAQHLFDEARQVLELVQLVVVQDTVEVAHRVLAVFEEHRVQLVLELLLDAGVAL
eukprot:CAMPEP_0168336612 /NCGR_PEP_ID=MMETSP0213-20121227/11658_1 /TAXON_ID=151035 /ORGANISM="Euplotes harpa, Strain FSP1.4" /LENGTH=191 /DNA_ID=CAMNT_0008341863 /DNA_START=39 /DNA_END=614 /DNA_ORIENTATION=-